MGVFKKRNTFAFVLNRIPPDWRSKMSARRGRVNPGSWGAQASLQARFLRGKAYPLDMLIRCLEGRKCLPQERCLSKHRDGRLRVNTWDRRGQQEEGQQKTYGVPWNHLLKGICEL